MASRHFAAVPPGGSSESQPGGGAPRLAKGGDGGDNGGMENRLRAVENSIIRIDAVLPTLATKEDLHKAVGDVRADLHKAVGDLRSELHKAIGDVRSELRKDMNEQTWKFVTFVTSVCIALTAAVYFIARNVH